MLGDTITLSLSGTGGTPLVLNKVNQDNFSSQYLKKESLSETSLNIRHTKDAVKAGQPARDRHNVTITRTVYPTEAKPQGEVYTFSATIVVQPDCSLSAFTDLGEALGFMLNDVTFLTKLHGWES